MNPLKHALLATAMVLGATNASATPYTATEVIDLGESYTFTDAKISVGSRSFSDTFTFTLGPGVDSASFLFNFGLPGSRIGSFAVTYDDDAIATTGGNVFESYTTRKNGKSFTYSVLDKVEYFFTLNDLDSSATSVSIAGTFEQAFSSPKSYSLTVTAASTVPEPGSLALMLAGVGLMAAVARRKSKAL